jgi:hypothetical protein
MNLNVQNVDVGVLTSASESPCRKDTKSSMTTSNPDLKTEAPNLDVNKVRLVFLDVDGVINSVKTSIFANGYPHLDTRGDNFLVPKLINERGFDRYAIDLINKLLRSTNSHIVLSSSWRIGVDTYQIRYFMEKIGFEPTRIIGKTANSGTRGEEIFNYLQGTGEKRSMRDGDYYVNNGRLIKSLANVEMTVDSYVIIDDIDEFLEDQKRDHLVLTDGYEGLSLSDTLLAGSKLTDKEFGIPQLVKGENHSGHIISPHHL